jgi:hypothetical protein
LMLWLALLVDTYDLNKKKKSTVLDLRGVT